MEKSIYDDDQFSIKVLSGETILFDRVNDRTHFLNSTAVKILEFAYQGKNKEEIERAMREYFDIQESLEINGDIEKTLLIFREKNLIEL